MNQKKIKVFKALKILILIKTIQKEVFYLKKMLVNKILTNANGFQNGKRWEMFIKGGNI